VDRKVLHTIYKERVVLMKTTARSLHLAGGIAALLLASTFTGFGITNSIPQSWSFETKTNGEDIVDISTDSWYGEPGTFVATNGTYDTPQNGYPIDTSHNVYAHLSAPVTNQVQGGADKTVWIDHMVKPERWKQDDPPSDLPSDTQMAYFVNTNGHLVVYHCQLATSGARVSNIWSEVDSVAIGSNDWARISIGMIYNDAVLDWTWYYYQIKINGTLVTHTNAVSPSEGNYNGGGSYFALANESASKLNSIVMKGNGDFDDFVVSTNTPVFHVKYVITAAVAAGATGGTLNPEGSILVDEGSNQVFTITASNFWTIEKVVVVENGVTTTNTSASSPYTNTFTSVTNEGSISVYFLASATNGVPLWWMDQAGISGSDPDLDIDGDGFTSSEEYTSSTDPNNSNSFLRITRTWQENGTNYVQWESAFIDTTLPPFDIMSSTDLVNDAFSPAGVLVRGTTNTWGEAAPTAGTFYKVSATNAP